jgi:tetratricopeptide (TPR) repeat protein
VAQAEWLLSQGDPPGEALTAEKAARAAIFLSENRSVWSWYVLARTAERAGEDAATVKDRLAHGLYYPRDFRSTYDTTVFTLHADFAVLPQARTPLTSWQSYEPWLRLAALHKGEGDWQAAREIYERVLRDDPYAWDVRAQLDDLSVAYP